MKLGDFSSVIQLGVGIHAGTAILQLLAEFKTVPLEKRIERAAAFVDCIEKEGSTNLNIQNSKDKIENIKI